MSEEELNKKWLKDELKEFSYSNEFFDKILDLLYKQYINGLEQSRFEKNLLEQENKKLKEQLEASEKARKEAIEYLTSYKSISEIQGIDDVEENKKLDEKTMNEMIRRYLNVHDKTLEILDIDKGE